MDMNATRSEAGFADINGTRMYYEIAGAGEPLALVHAGIADCRMWDEQFGVLARDFTVVRYDTRGYGKTAAVEGPFARHRDLAALLDYFGFGRTALVGCSIGGRTIIDLALARPDSIAALVAVAPALSGYVPESVDPPQWSAALKAYEQGDLELVAECEVQIWVDGPARGTDQVPASVRDRVRQMNLIPLAVPEGLGEELPLDPPADGRLQEIHVPMLLVVGELDQPSALEQSTLIAEHVPHAEKVTLATAHLPSMERPDEFNEIVLAFLRRLEQAAGEARREERLAERHGSRTHPGRDHRPANGFEDRAGHRTGSCSSLKGARANVRAPRAPSMTCRLTPARHA